MISLPTERLFETDYGHYCGFTYEQSRVVASELVDSGTDQVTVPGGTASGTYSVTFSATLTFEYAAYLDGSIPESDDIA